MHHTTPSLLLRMALVQALYVQLDVNDGATVLQRIYTTQSHDELISRHAFLLDKYQFGVPYVHVFQAAELSCVAVSILTSADNERKCAYYAVITAFEGAVPLSQAANCCQEVLRGMVQDHGNIQSYAGLFGRLEQCRDTPDELLDLIGAQQAKPIQSAMNVLQRLIKAKRGVVVTSAECPGVSSLLLITLQQLLTDNYGQPISPVLQFLWNLDVQDEPFDEVLRQRDTRAIYLIGTSNRYVADKLKVRGFDGVEVSQGEEEHDTTDLNNIVAGLKLLKLGMQNEAKRFLNRYFGARWKRDCGRLVALDDHTG